MDINLVKAMQEVSTRGLEQARAFTSSKKDNKLILDKAAALAAQQIEKMDKAATILCPVTGLPVENNLPATGSFYMVAMHPFAFNALAIMDHPAFYSALSEREIAGLILASLHSMGKLAILPDSNAFSINMRLATLFSKAQLIEFYVWLNKNLRKGKRYYPALELSLSTLNADTFINYTLCLAQIQAYSASVDIAGSKEEETKISALPAPTNVQVRRMDSNAYDEWLDLCSKDILPKTFKDKAKPYVKTLVSNLNEKLVNGLIEKAVSIAKEIAEDAFNGLSEEEGEVIVGAAELFGLEVRALRKKAEALGFYQKEMDEWSETASVISGQAQSQAQESHAVALESSKDPKPASTGLSFLQKIGMQK